MVEVDWLVEVIGEVEIISVVGAVVVVGCGRGGREVGEVVVGLLVGW